MFRFHNYSVLLTIIFTFITMRSYAQREKDLIADGEKLTLVSEKFAFTEGPASDKDGNIYFTDQPNNQILKWNAEDNSIETFLKPAGRSNGLYLDQEQNIIAAADERTGIWRIYPDKKIDTLLSSYNNKNLNGPNDVWAHPGGGIYLTDPFYDRPWWDYKSAPQPQRNVYYLPKDATKPVIVADNLTQPNGIIGTPDGRLLYVSDIDANKIYRYDVNSDGKLSNRMLFANEKSDGMTIDNQGNIYLSGNGVTILNKNGDKIGHIEVPQDWTANVTFGGKDHKTLFITALKAVYTLKMKVSGTQW